MANFGIGTLDRRAFRLKSNNPEDAQEDAQASMSALSPDDSDAPRRSDAPPSGFVGDKGGQDVAEYPAPSGAAPDEPVPGTSDLISVPAPGATDSGDTIPDDTDPDNLPEQRSLPHAEVRRIFIGLMLAIFVAALNQTIIASPLPTIGRAFGDFENLSWVVTAYLLTSTAVAPLYGKLSEIHGRRAMMLVALGVFTFGSLVSALAPNLWVLVIGRALQGVGGGGLLPLAQTIIADIVSPRERGSYQAYVGLAWVGAGISGPLLGGILAQHLHWSLVFWVNVPLGLAGYWMADRTLRHLPMIARKHQLDLLGAVLLMAAAVPLLLALSWGGARYPWMSPTIGGLMVLSLVLSLVFAWRMTQAREPFLPLPVLANPVMRMSTLSGSATLGTAIGITIFAPLYFETVHGLSASMAGLALVPLVAMSTPGSLLSGWVMSHRQHYKWVPLVGLFIAIAAFLGLVWKPDTSLWIAVTALTVANMGIGCVYPVCTVSMQNAVQRHEVGIATGAANFFRSLGSALIVAVMGAIVLAHLGNAPERGMASAKLNAGAVASADHANLVATFGHVFLTAAGFLLLGLIAMALMQERPLRGPPEPTV
jgi:EmrB/QacA subfamily drug resistance transporter